MTSTINLCSPHRNCMFSSKNYYSRIRITLRIVHRISFVLHHVSNVRVECNAFNCWYVWTTFEDVSRLSHLLHTRCPSIRMDVLVKVALTVNVRFAKEIHMCFIYFVVSSLCVSDYFYQTNVRTCRHMCNILCHEVLLDWNHTYSMKIFCFFLFVE